MKRFSGLLSHFKIHFSKNLRQHLIVTAIIFISLAAILSGILAILYHKILPFISPDTADVLSDGIFGNTFLLLIVLLILSATVAWFISDGRYINRQLKKRLDMDEQLMEMVDDSIFIHNLDGNCLYASRLSKNGGYTREELRNINYYSLKDSVYDDLIKPRIEGLLSTGEASFEAICFLKSSRPLPVKVHSRIIASGNQNSVLSIVRDITDRKRAEEELRKSSDKLLRAMKGTINSMASVVEVKDPYTAGHQQRVAKLAAAIAGELKMSEEQIEGIRMAGTLHDIGKICVPSEILSKPGKLKDSEFELIKEHSAVGYELLKTIEFSQPVAQMVLQHHERMDGSGYPASLPGYKILYGARILGIADVIESMSSHRPYRPAFSIEQALQEIMMKKGILYDTQIVDACVTIFNDQGFTFDQ